MTYVQRMIYLKKSLSKVGQEGVVLHALPPAQGGGGCRDDARGPERLKASSPTTLQQPSWTVPAKNNEWTLRGARDQRSPKDITPENTILFSIITFLIENPFSV